MNGDDLADFLATLDILLDVKGLELSKFDRSGEG